MSDNPFAFDKGPRGHRERREPRPARKPAGGGSALPWVLAGVGGLVVLAGVSVGLYLALGGKKEGPMAKGKTETERKAETEKAGGGKATEAPPGGDLPAELVKRARDAMAVIDVRSSDGHHERGAGFLYSDDLMVGFEPIDAFHKLVGSRTYTEIAFQPEDARLTPDDYRYLQLISKGRCFLLVRNPKKLAPVPLADSDPSEEDEVFVLGYTGGPGTKAAFQVTRARVGSRVLNVGNDYSYDLDFVPPAGFVFGGPVLDRQGRAVGAVLPPKPGKKTADLYPIDWVRDIHKGHMKILDDIRKAPRIKFKPQPPPEPPAAWETGGLDAAVFLRVKEGLGEVTGSDSGYIVNWACVTYISPDLALTRGKMNVGRNKFVYKSLDYSVLEDAERTWGGGKPKVELADDALNITVFRVEAKKRKPGLELSPDEVKVGDKLWVFGRWKMPAGTPLKPRPYSARPTKVVSVEGAEGKSPVVELDFALPAGEDGRFGGPVVDAKGRVVGVVLPIGKDEKTARMVPATAVRKSLSENKLLE